MKTKTKYENVALASKMTKEIKTIIFDFKEAFKQIDNILFVFRHNKLNKSLDIYVNKKIIKCKILSYKLIKEFNNRKGISFTKPLICSNNELFHDINAKEFKTNDLKRVINFFTETNSVNNKDILRIRGFSVLVEEGICSRVKLRSLGPSIDLEILEVLDFKE